MPPRLVALDEGPDIMLDRGMIVVGRHPGCDARLDSLRVSRHHCCVMPEDDEVVVRDLGSTNGVRINGQRVDMGRLKLGDELSIAHFRYRLDDGRGAEPSRSAAEAPEVDAPGDSINFIPASTDEDVLAAAVRRMLPSSIAEKCRIRVIVHMDDGLTRATPEPSPSPSVVDAEESSEWPSN